MMFDFYSASIFEIGTINFGQKEYNYCILATLVSFLTYSVSMNQLNILQYQVQHITKIRTAVEDQGILSSILFQ